MAKTVVHDASALKILDLAVVGAGIYGIQAARTYLHLHPTAQVRIFETSDCIGGVWSSKRVYDDFWTQTPLRILEFSDMTLEGVAVADTHHGFFKAEHVAKYLEEYVNTRFYAGSSLKSRMRLRSHVKVLTKQQTGWNLCVETENNHVMSYSARKVIDATGLTSTANIPSIPGRDMFPGTVIHHKDFGNYQDSILSKAGPQDVVVLGGAKSAADVAYACAKRGKNVTWVIRRSGAGPAAFVSAKGRGMYKNSNESFYTRLVSYFLASIFIKDSKMWLERFLHRTKLGSWVLRRIWKGINDKAHKAANYDRVDGVANGFYNLKPDTEIFWQNDSTGIDLHDDFFDTIAKRVKVHRADVQCFTHTGLQLDDGTIIDAQVVVFATGWRTSHPSIQTNDGTDLALRLGLSVLNSEQNTDTSTDWIGLEKTAATEILQRFPMLGSPPRYYQHAPDDIAPLRLYKGMLPVEDRSIVFLGQMMLGNHFRAAEVQALYAVAALDGTLKLPSKTEMKRSIAGVISWCRLRYLAKGAHGNWLYWDLVPYTDKLLDELELRSHRHKSRWKDLFSPCFATDLRGLIDEYKRKNQNADRGNDVSDGKS